MPTTPLRERKAWQALERHYAEISGQHLRDLFAADPQRGERLTAEAAGIYLDYSKNRVTDETMRAADRAGRAESGVAERRDAMFRGEHINVSENRAVLHVALRLPATDDADRGRPGRRGATCTPCSAACATFSDRVRSGEFKGFTGKPIKNVDQRRDRRIRPRAGHGATRRSSITATREITFRFVSNVDSTDFVEAIRDLRPDETLFIISSKTFGTLETLTNAAVGAGLGGLRARAPRTRSPTTSWRCRPTPTKVSAFGIDTANMFGFWDWVGGRYSMDSAIGLSTMIALGADQFDEMLAGFHDMDEHFRTAPLASNLPVLMGLLAVWYRDFFGCQTVGVMPYDQYLKRFPAYLQQLTMESNGKHVTLAGQHVDYDTGAVYWGEPGTNGQHSFYQLIHQGTVLIPVDLIGFARTLNPLGEHHDQLSSNVFAQAAGARVRQDRGSRCGPRGRAGAWCRTGCSRATARRTRCCATSSPRGCSGPLVALYEHSVFVQGTIWDIDSFDQWGVELGKQLAQQHHPRADVRVGAGAHARLVHQRPDPSLPITEVVQGGVRTRHGN